MRRQIPLLILFAVSRFACSASGQSGKPTQGTTGGGGLNLASGGTGSLQLGGSNGLSLGGDTTTTGGMSDLPPPWQYYAEGDSFGFKDSTLGDDVRGAFPATETATGAPKLLYPLPGSMHPMNLGDITFQWLRGRSTDSLFRIDVEADKKSFKLYVPCADSGSTAPEACIYKLPESEWLDLGARFKGGSIKVSVASAAAGAKDTAKSAPATLAFSPEPVLGGLYYWSQTKSGIMRATFGSKRAELFIAPRSPTNDYACAGCHSVSRDGKVIAFAAQADRDFPGMGIQVAPTSAPDQPMVRPTKGISPSGAGYPRTPGREEPQDQFGQSVALNRDGSVAAVNGARFDGQPPGEEWFELRDARTGMPLMNAGKPAQWIIGDPLFGPNQLPILPEWSADGKNIAATLMNRQNGCGWTMFSCAGTIVTIPVTGSTIGAVRPLVTPSASDPMFHFYPSWSPDGKYIAFASAPVGNPKGSSDNHNAVLRVVPSSGGPYPCPGPKCYELTNGTRYTVADAVAGAGKGSTWPKFTPFSQAAGNIMFVSFTSRIDYGVLSKERAQLWMFAIDVSKLGSGEDASYAPIWLPHQEIEDQNFTPYWTEILPCNVDADGGCQGCVGSERCVVDHDNQCQCSVTTIVK
jgi:WD40-like Beta Propeller Repeat